MSSTELALAEQKPAAQDVASLGTEPEGATPPVSPSASTKARPTLTERISSPSESPRTGFRAWLSRSYSRIVTALSPRTPMTVDEASFDVPQNFLDSCGGNRRKAIAKFRAWRAWRKEIGLEDMLFKGHPKYDVIRKAYPQVLHGLTPDGETISIETPAGLDIEMLKQHGVKPEDLAAHLAVMFEWVDRVKMPGTDNHAITIMDCKDLPLSKVVSSDWLAIVRATTEVMDNYYPGRQRKIIMVNTPAMFGTVWKVIKNVMPGNVGRTVDIIPLKDLKKYVPLEQLPAYLGGTGTTELGQDPLELAAVEYFTTMNASGSREGAAGGN